MSRHPREYPVADRYEDRDSEFYHRPRRDYDDLEVDITRSRYPESRRAETTVKERDSAVSGRRGPRQPDFLREDYGKSTTAGALVVRDDERRDDDTHSRAPTRRRSVETVRSRAPTERVEKDRFVFEERERSDRGLPYPRDRGSELGFRGRGETEEKVIFRERTRSRPPPREEVDTEEKVIFRERTRSRPPPRERGSREEIDINIRREESRGPPPARSPPPVEEIRFRRGGGDRPSPRATVEKTEIDITREESRGPPPRPRSTVEREEIDIREQRSAAPRPPRTEIDEKEFIFRDTHRSSQNRGREVVNEEIDIDIRERSAPPPRQRSMSRGNLVVRKEEEWIVRRPRTPPPQDYEKEEIIIRRKERTPSPEPPPREPTPEPSPPPPPPLEPIFRPPIIQEVITHHRHIDHGVERARSPTPPPPAPPSPPPPPKETKEDNLEIEIKRRGMRNGKAYEEDIIIERDRKDTEEPSRELERYEDRRRDLSVASRRRSPSARRRYDDEIAAEADYYNRKITSRAHPGEAYNGATRDWGLVDIPPGTERVRMDGVGGGAQEVYWERYSGNRRGRFISGDRAYEQEYGNGNSAPSPAPLSPPPAPYRERDEEIKITHTRTNEEKPRRRDRMWTEVTKDLVIKEAIDEMGYDYEETDEHFYVIEYLKYVSLI